MIDRHERPLRAAVVGCGLIAAQHLACLCELANATTVAVCDTSPTIAAATAERFGVPRWYTEHRELLEAEAPDVVHVATPFTSHFSIARDALQSGAHAIVEKPIAVTYEEWSRLREIAQGAGRWLIEDYNYLFDPRVEHVRGLLGTDLLGSSPHVDVRFFQAIGDASSAFSDPYAPHPSLSAPGGAVTDFLPHMASLLHGFIGPHRSVSTLWTKRSAGSASSRDEFVGLVEGASGTGTMAFNANSAPQGFWLHVYGARAQARIGLYEGVLNVDRVRGGPSFLTPIGNGIGEAVAAGRGAFTGAWRKVSGGPGSYEGLWILIARVYAALASGAPPPVTMETMDAVNRLVAECVRPEGGA